MLERFSHTSPSFIRVPPPLPLQVANGIQGSQAFAAYDAGLDVWLGNARSNPPRMHAGWQGVADHVGGRGGGGGARGGGGRLLTSTWARFPAPPVHPASLHADAKLSGGSYWHYTLNELGTQDVAAQVRARAPQPASASQW